MVRYTYVRTVPVPVPVPVVKFIERMSDRLSSSKKWTVALLLGAAGTAVVAGGIALGIYYVRKRRNAVDLPPQEPVHDETQPLIPVVEEPVMVVEEPIMPVVEETCTATMDMKVPSHLCLV